MARVFGKGVVSKLRQEIKNGKSTKKDKGTLTAPLEAALLSLKTGWPMKMDTPSPEKSRIAVDLRRR